MLPSYFLSFLRSVLLTWDGSLHAICCNPLNMNILPIITIIIIIIISCVHCSSWFFLLWATAWLIKDADGAIATQVKTVYELRIPLKLGLRRLTHRAREGDTMPRRHSDLFAHALCISDHAAVHAGGPWVHLFWHNEISVFSQRPETCTCRFPPSNFVCLGRFTLLCDNTPMWGVQTK